MQTQETTTTDLVRIVDGRTVPTTGVWSIDPTHTQAEFVARHLMVSKVRGGFSEISGTIEVAEDPVDSKVEVTIGVASVSSGTDDRDAHLKSADFFDVENHPTMVFRSTKVEAVGSAWKLTGDLTIKDTTRVREGFARLIFRQLPQLLHTYGRKDAEQAVAERIDDEGIAIALAAELEERSRVSNQRGAGAEPRHRAPRTRRHGLDCGAYAEDGRHGPTRVSESRRDWIVDGNPVALDHVDDVGKVDGELEVAVHANFAAHEGAHRVHLSGRERDPVAGVHVDRRVLRETSLAGDESGGRPLA